jgi:hypothetical protein
MKKVFAILSATILLASVLQVSIDRHYCGGELADIKLSLSGELASCGMEPKTHESTHQSTFDKRCCEDELTFYNLSTKYLPVNITISSDNSQKEIIPYHAIAERISSPEMIISTLWVRPPGENPKNDHSLSRICVYRI